MDEGKGDRGSVGRDGGRGEEGRGEEGRGKKNTEEKEMKKEEELQMRCAMMGDYMAYDEDGNKEFIGVENEDPVLAEEDYTSEELWQEEKGHEEDETREPRPDEPEEYCNCKITTNAEYCSLCEVVCKICGNYEFFDNTTEDGICFSCYKKNNYQLKEEVK